VNRDVVARSAVAAIGAVALVAGSFGAVSAFRSAIASDPPGIQADAADPAGRRELDRIHHAQFECIRGRVQDALGSGATVHVPLDPAAPEPDLWQQRLVEMAFPHATIVDAPAPGVTTLTVASDATGDGCTGVVLVVTTTGAGPGVDGP